MNKYMYIVCNTPPMPAIYKGRRLRTLEEGNITANILPKNVIGICQLVARRDTSFLGIHPIQVYNPYFKLDLCHNENHVKEHISYV